MTDDILSNVIANIVTAAFLASLTAAVPYLKKWIKARQITISTIFEAGMRVLQFTFSYAIPIAGIIRVFIIFDNVDKWFIAILMMWSSLLIVNYIRDVSASSRIRTLRLLKEAMEKSAQ